MCEVREGERCDPRAPSPRSEYLKRPLMRRIVEGRHHGYARHLAGVKVHGGVVALNY